MKIDGLEELQNSLKELQQNAKSFEGEQEIPFEKLFSHEFLLKNSTFKSFEEFSSGEIFENYDSFEDIPDNELDKYISDNSSFNTWEDFSAEAIQDYVAKQLGF